MTAEQVRIIMDNTPREELERQAAIERKRRAWRAAFFVVGFLFILLGAVAAIAGLCYIHWKSTF